MEGEIREMPVEPLRDQAHAQQIAEEWLVKNRGYTWTGQWHNKIPGKMAVIMVVKLPPQATPGPQQMAPSPQRKRMIEVPQVKDENDANGKAHKWMSENPGWRFTGSWKGGQGQMSMIEVEEAPGFQIQPQNFSAEEFNQPQVPSSFAAQQVPLPIEIQNPQQVPAANVAPIHVHQENELPHGHPPLPQADQISQPPLQFNQTTVGTEQQYQIPQGYQQQYPQSQVGYPQQQLNSQESGYAQVPQGGYSQPQYHPQGYPPQQPHQSQPYPQQQYQPPQYQVPQGYPPQYPQGSYHPQQQPYPVPQFPPQGYPYPPQGAVYPGQQPPIHYVQQQTHHIVTSHHGGGHYGGGHYGGGHHGYFSGHHGGGHH